MRNAASQIRFAWAAAFALLLALRLLTRAGFMPSFDHGAVTIVTCPEADAPMVSPMSHHHGDHRSVHQPCPYAETSALGALGADWMPVTVPFFAVALLLGRAFLFVERQQIRERPPAIGPPIPA